MYCDICRQFPHHPRCPNAPDPPVVYYCNMCNEESGERVNHLLNIYNINGAEVLSRRKSLYRGVNSHEIR